MKTKNTNEDRKRKSNSYTQRWPNLNRSWHHVARNRKKIKTWIRRKNEGECNELGCKNPVFNGKEKTTQEGKNEFYLSLPIGENTWILHESKEREKIFLALFLFLSIFSFWLIFFALNAVFPPLSDIFLPPRFFLCTQKRSPIKPSTGTANLENHSAWNS